jgi:hypothetical protein
VVSGGSLEEVTLYFWLLQDLRTEPLHTETGAVQGKGCIAAERV